GRRWRRPHARPVEAAGEQTPETGAERARRLLPIPRVPFPQAVRRPPHPALVTGRATDLVNLILLCRRHHTVVHKHQLRIERTGAAFAGAMQGPAAFAFSLPDGSQLLPLE